VASITGENFLCRWGLKACETTTHQALTKEMFMLWYDLHLSWIVVHEITNTLSLLYDSASHMPAKDTTSNDFYCVFRFINLKII